MRFKSIDYNNSTFTGWMFGYNIQYPDIQRFVVEHCEDLSNYFTVLNHVIALDYSPTKNKKKGFDFRGQLISALNHFNLEHLSIKSTFGMETIPEEINNHRLRQLRITGDFSNLADILKNQTDIEELEITNYNMDSFPYLPKLKKLILTTKKEVNLDDIINSPILEGVEISVHNKTLPKSFEKLAHLEYLSINNCTALESLPVFESLKKLEQINFYNLSKLNADPIFPNLPNLTKIRIHSIQKDTDLSQFFSQTSALEEISISHLNTLPQEIVQNKNLSEFIINHIEEEFPDLTPLKSIQKLWIKHCKTKDIPFDFTNISNLDIRDCPNIEKLNGNFENLHKITLNTLKNLESLPELQQSINEIVYVYLDKITEIPSDLDTFKNLNYIELDFDFETVPDYMVSLKASMGLNSKALKVFPENYLFHKNRFVISSFDHYVGAHIELFNKTIEEIDIRKAIYFWYRKGQEVDPITDEIKINTLKSYKYGHRFLRQIANDHLSFLNTPARDINADDIQSGKVVLLNGSMSGKTKLKDKLKDHGCKVVQKFSDKVDVIVLGTKAKYTDGMLDNNVIFTHQYLIEELLKDENPDLLEQEDLPVEYIRNLQELIWSNDSSNTGIALEMVKNNGFPRTVVGDFIEATKSCRDSKLKTKIKTFLKGKLSDDTREGISGRYISFDKLDKALAADILHARTRRSGTKNQSYFQYAPDNHVHRQYMLDIHYPTWRKAKKLEPSYCVLNADDINYILRKKESQNIKGLFLNLLHCKKFPEAVIEHKDTLIHLTLYVNKDFDLSPIYEMEKLTQLTVSIREENVTEFTIPEGISKLRKLSKLNINSAYTRNISIHYPSDFDQLKKLKK